MFGATVLGAAGESGSTAYQIANSLRFDGVDDYLSRTFGTPTDGTKWALSIWTKRGVLSVAKNLISSFNSGAAAAFFTQFTAADKIYVFLDKATTGTATLSFTSDAVFRDPTAWYNVHISFDASQATTALALSVYVNGVKLTGTYTGTIANVAYMWNSAMPAQIGRYENNPTYYYSGYIAEIYNVDGQALTPSSFGETDSNGVWVPKAYTGSYGNNGFHLDFSDGTSTTTLGYDAAGSNDWTLTGMTRAAGVNECWVTDTPTDNFCTWNSLKTTSGNTYSNGNLQDTNSHYTQATAGTIAASSGKYYWEIVRTGGSDNISLGVRTVDSSQVDFSSSANYWTYFGATGGVTNGGGYPGSAYGATFTTNDVIGVALDLDNAAVYFSKNGTWQNSGDPTSGASKTGAAFTNVVGNITAFAGETGTGGVQFAANFGQRDFAYTPPTGFKALSTANLPAVSITNPKAHFDVKTRSGTSATATVTGIGFAPDLIWAKDRNSGAQHQIHDILRGGLSGTKNQELSSSSTSAEGVTNSCAFTQTSDGYTMSDGSSTWNPNTTGVTYVDWLWKSGGAPTTDNVAGAGNVPTAGSVKIDGVNMSSALAGTIAATRLSANTTAGFSIVTFTNVPSSATNYTAGHGLSLSTAPALVILKKRGVAGDNWFVWHKSLASTTDSYLTLNGTGGTSTATNIWGAGHTSTVIGFRGSTISVGTSDTFVAYVFGGGTDGTGIPGYSKFGSYVGNGSADGTFCFTGFRPRWVMIKQSSAAGADWVVVDTARSVYNESIAVLFPDTSGAEGGTGYANMDITANGFKLRTNGAASNASATYIFAAFAEMPSGGSNVSPAPAR